MSKEILCALIVTLAIAGRPAHAAVTVTASASGVQKGGNLTFTATTDASDPVVQVTFTYEGTSSSDQDTTSPYQVTRTMNWSTMENLTVTATFDFQNIPNQQGTVDVDVVDITLIAPSQPLRGTTLNLFSQTDPSGISVSSWSWRYLSVYPDITWTDTSNSDDQTVWSGTIAVSGTLEISASILGVPCTRSQGIAVRNRGGGVWDTPVSCVEDNEPNWGSPPYGLGETLGQERDRESNTNRIIVPQSPPGDWSDGVTLRQVPSGANEGIWYVRTNVLEIDQETVINQFLKSGGPLPALCAAENWYSYNNASGQCLSGVAGDFVQAVMNHEYRGTPPAAKSDEGHFGRIEKELDYTGDPAVAIEDLTATSESALMDSVNSELELIEASLGLYSGGLDGIANGPNWGSGAGSLGTGKHTRFDPDNCVYYSGCTFGPDEF